MADEHTGEQGSVGKRMKRRGLIAGAAALAAGIMAKRAPPPVAANGGTWTLPYYGTTTAQNSSGDGFAVSVYQQGNTLHGIRGRSDNGTGVQGDSTYSNGVAGYGSPGVYGHNGSGGTGVYGTSDGSSGSGVGVYGETTNGAIAVWGRYQGTGSGTGVQGDSLYSNGSGVKGISGTGDGVYGTSSGSGNGVHGVCNGASNSYGVWGQSDLGHAVHGGATGGGGSGVYGYSSSSAAGNGNGVYGRVDHIGTTQVTAGVFGDSNLSYGVIGRTTAAGYSGITGITTTPGAAAFAGASTVAGAYAAYFVGSVVVQGDFAVVGGAKNAAVKHADGSYRLLHCVESPEAWFEDFGEAKLANGKAEIKLDTDFAAVVDTSAYHVFLTSHGDFHVHTTQRTPGGFAVQQTTGTGSAGASGTFSYRIVAKRADLKVGRLAKFELPKIRLPKPEEMPPPPEPPKAAPSPLPVTKP